MKFTLMHGFAASLLIHGLIGLPLVVPGQAAVQEPPRYLAMDLQALVGQMQVNEALQRDVVADEGVTSSVPDPVVPPPDMAQQVAQEAVRQPTPPEPVTPEPGNPAAPPPQQAVPQQAAPRPEKTADASAPPAADSAASVAANERAQTIQQSETEDDVRRRYSRLVAKKVRSHLVYPEAGRHARLRGSPRLSFTILPDGNIRTDSLKVVASSGVPKLDASALETIRAVLPFDAPPSEMTVTITVGYDDRH